MRKILLTIIIIVTLSLDTISQTNNKKEDYIVMGKDTIPQTEVVKYTTDTIRVKYILEGVLYFELKYKYFLETATTRYSSTTIKTTSFQSKPIKKEE